jgi:DNA-binding NtrC family response regulator
MIPGMERDGRVETHSLSLRKVLIVDEALPVRRKLIEILHRAGVGTHEVYTAETAEKALETFVAEHPPLVFCEFVGEASCGLEMILEMLTLAPQTKLVLVTAEDPHSTLVRQAIRAGVFSVVRKPLRHETIRAVMAEIEAEEGGIERFR